MIRPLAKGHTPAWVRLLAPFRYLSIQHGHKARFDWIWPGILTVVTVAGFCSLPIQPALLGEHGVLQGVHDLIVLFSAFFVASLAAVATFAPGSLDELMRGTSPLLRDRELTRRQFVCHLFGYLAVLSFLLFLAIVGAQIVDPSLHVILSPTLFSWLKLVAGTIFTFAFWNMMVTTLLGVYFLIERVNINEPAVADEGPRGSRRRSESGQKTA
jgi:hypothetical protein